GFWGAVEHLDFCGIQGVRQSRITGMEEPLAVWPLRSRMTAMVAAPLLTAPLLTATEELPGVYALRVSTTALFQAVEVGVQGDVANGVNLVPDHPVLAGRLLVSGVNGLRVLAPLGSPETNGVFQPGVNHDIDLTYGLTTPTPGDWVDGLAAEAMLRFELVSGDAVASVRLFRGGGVVDEFSVAVSASRPLGDYDGDGAIGAADYQRWRETLGDAVTPAGLAADGNANGVVDAADYTVWRDRLEATPAAAASLPEPDAAALIGLAACLRCAGGRRHARIAYARRLCDSRPCARHAKR
ncbi:MAG: hypothetical protein AAGB00_13285, partial [Planctomycetota bacterium]